MTLSDLASELFLYLVVFRRRVAKGLAPKPTVVGQELEALFKRLDTVAAGDPQLNARYKGIRRVLAMAADGIISASDWKDALDYRTFHLLEDRLYPIEHSQEGSVPQMGGIRFFQCLEGLQGDSYEEKEVFLQALALGFTGMHATNPEKLHEIKRRLYADLCQGARGFPGQLVERVTPAAYEHLDKRNCTVPPLEQWTRYSLILAGLFVFLLIVGHVVYHQQTKTISDIVSIKRGK